MLMIVPKCSKVISSYKFWIGNSRSSRIAVCQKTSISKALRCYALITVFRWNVRPKRKIFDLVSLTADTCMAQLGVGGKKEAGNTTVTQCQGLKLCRGATR